MARFVRVTPEQVEAARIHVRAYRNAGLDPDPVVARMANARVLRGGEAGAASPADGARPGPDGVVFSKRSRTNSAQPPVRVEPRLTPAEPAMAPANEPGSTSAGQRTGPDSGHSV